MREQDDWLTVPELIESINVRLRDLNGQTWGRERQPLARPAEVPTLVE